MGGSGMSGMGRKADRPLLGSQTALADVPDAAALPKKDGILGIDLPAHYVMRNARDQSLKVALGWVPNQTYR